MMARQKLAASIFALAIFAGASTPTYAGYDANVSGEITILATYPSGDIFIRLSTQPASHPSCAPSYFAIDSTAPGKDAMYARALAAFTAGMPINIGYDSQGNCVGSSIRVHRVG
jgi:hypothetical protein